MAFFKKTNIAFTLMVVAGGIAATASCSSDDPVATTETDSGTSVTDSGTTKDSSTVKPDAATDAGATSAKIGGTVVGLDGTGLVLTNGGTDVVVPKGATTFAFPTALASGTAYNVTVKSQPNTPVQTCTVANGTGTVGKTDVTNITVTCATATYDICAMVTGLATGTGDAGISEAGTGALVLRNNAVDGGAGDSVSVGANGQVCFPTKVPAGGSYSVTAQNPTNPVHTCTVTGGTGVVVAGNVTTVAVNCSISTFTIGGNVTGLAGTGAVATLRDGSGNPLQTAPLNMVGAYAFTNPVPSGQRYDVVVSTQPTGPSQTCTVSNGTGQVAGANVTNANIDCVTRSFTVGGTLKVPSGTITMRNNGGNDLTAGPGSVPFTFTTAVLSGATYNVTVPNPPAGTTCVVTNGAGTIGAANVTNVVVDCAQTVTFDYTGAVQTYTVPAGVTSVFLKAFGAQGAAGAAGGNGSAGGVGGLGGYAEGRLAVAAGSTLSIFVGGAGSGDAAGFNGGGAGGGTNAGGGGGASDVRTGAAAVANRVLVAGGGGGGGRAGCEAATIGGGAGGAGGGGNGADGTNAPTSGGNAGAGFGGVGATGGARGVGCSGFLGTAGSSSSSEVGGAGGAGQSCCCFTFGSVPGGGGGGGGFVGGGGGGGGSAGTTGCSGNDKGAGGGGAGGSSSVAGVTAGVMTSGQRAGNGQVTLTVSVP